LQSLRQVLAERSCLDCVAHVWNKGLNLGWAERSSMTLDPCVVPSRQQVRRHEMVIRNMLMLAHRNVRMP
jgi:hypothetical protein